MKTDELFFVKNIKELLSMEVDLNPHIKNKWNSKIDSIRRNPEQHRSNIEMLLGIIGFEEDLKLLDVGCGIGLDVIELSNIGAYCVGLDAAKDNIKLINHCGNILGPQAEGVYGDACNMPFNDDTLSMWS